MPGRSKVKDSEGTTTLTCDSGLMFRFPRNVSALRLDPYPRYNTVSDAIAPLAKAFWDSWDTSSGWSPRDARCLACEVIGIFLRRVLGREWMPEVSRH